MPDTNLVALDITIIADHLTLRQLEEVRMALYDGLSVGLAGEKIVLHQEGPTQATDPAVVGALAVALLPVVVDKLIQVIIDWIRDRQETSVTIKVPRYRQPPIVILVDPSVIHDRATLIQQVEAAMREVQAQNARNLNKA